MGKQEQTKWKDPRVPVSVSYVGKFKVTIYDINAYNASFMEYPDDPNRKPAIGKTNTTPSQFKKSKPASRYNWTTKLDKPLVGKINNTK